MGLDNKIIRSTGNKMVWKHICTSFVKKFQVEKGNKLFSGLSKRGSKKDPKGDPKRDRKGNPKSLTDLDQETSHIPIVDNIP